MIHVTSGLHSALLSKPDTAALISPEGVLTWAAFVGRVARGAAALRALGLARNDRVMILSENSRAFFEMFMVAPWADLILCSLNTRWSAAEIAAVMNDADADTLMVDARHAAMLPALRAARPALRHIIHLDGGVTQEGLLNWEEMIAAAAPMPDASRPITDTAYLFYTSGTTGAPKGVMLGVGGLVAGASIVMSAFGQDASMRYLVSTPLFDVGAASYALVHARATATMTIIPRFEPGMVLEVIARDRINQTTLVPTMVQMVIDHPDFSRHDLSTLRTCSYGAAPMPPALIARTKLLLPQVRFQQGYALTESGAIGTRLSPEDHRDPELLSTVGRAVPFVEIRILDKQGRTLPPGEAGEVTIASPALMQGYWRRPTETAAALQDGWLMTGDRGFLDTRGYLTLVDRIKDMIVTGGENVYSIEVENVIYSHDAVAECAVIGVPDPLWGEIVVAAVHLREGRHADERALVAVVRERIGGYKVPRRVVFMDEPLPKNSAGKIFKPAIREQLAHG